jgi:glycolate oxidase
MSFNKMTDKLLRELELALGKEKLFYDRQVLEEYSHDYTEDLKFYPEVVFKPGSPEEIQHLVKWCSANNIPITPRGAGTGLSGGALPVHGGVLLSMEKMNRILNIDEENFTATVEPGLINETFQYEVMQRGLFYPPDPASKGSCSLGGNIAENAGGPRAVKYGVTSNYVLNLEMVLPSGELIWTGADTLKNATGYNLTQLVVGSEGTLGIVTKIVLRLIPKPEKNMLLWVPFKNAEAACAAVNKVFKAGITPSCIEFMERDALICAYAFLDKAVGIADDINAVLLIEVDGNDEDQIMQECEKIGGIMMTNDSSDVQLADASAQKEEWWRIRRCIGEAVKHSSIYKEEDTVVPRGRLPELLNGVKAVGKKYGFTSVCYGHAGDGNLHVNILKGNMSGKDWNEKINDAIREIFIHCKNLGGTISGEHGIGYVQKSFMDIVFSEVQLNLMRAIKKAFDPSGIMNPGKIL